ASTHTAVPWKYAFDGDPLYTPFKGISRLKTEDILNEEGVKIGIRRYDSSPMEEHSSSISGGLGTAFKEYDLNGNITREVLENGQTLIHLPSGQTVIMSHDGITVPGIST